MASPFLRGREMPNPLECDVLIAGTGPTGMAAGIALHHYGYKAILIDRHLNGLDFSRAILVNQSALKALAPFGVAEKILQAGIPFTSMAIRGPKGNLLYGQTGDFGQEGIRPTALPQLETERCMMETIKELGITVIRPSKLVSFKQFGDRVESTTEEFSRSRIIVSSYLLGADGAHSLVRQALGIDHRSTTAPLRMYSQDAVISLENEPDLGIWILNTGAAMAMRIGHDRFRFAATSRSTFDELKLGPRIQKTLWESDFDVYFAQVECYGKGRVWIAGDAAHIHSPIGGRGMNMGIADGVRFAEAVRSGDFDSYAAERHQISAAWVKKNRIFTTLISSPSIRGHAFRHFIRGVFLALFKIHGSRAAEKVFSKIAQG